MGKSVSVRKRCDAAGRCKWSSPCCYMHGLPKRRLVVCDTIGLLSQRSASALFWFAAALLLQKNAKGIDVDLQSEVEGRIRTMQVGLDRYEDVVAALCINAAVQTDFEAHARKSGIEVIAPKASRPTHKPLSWCRLAANTRRAIISAGRCRPREPFCCYAKAGSMSEPANSNYDNSFCGCRRPTAFDR